MNGIPKALSHNQPSPFVIRVLIQQHPLLRPGVTIRIGYEPDFTAQPIHIKIRNRS